ncbi:MAG: hypothetical protein LUC33_05395, partial [Prevotellaceae bacterium]|nr:hypothetical protein [Prevotellaceae bacterium]
TLRMTDGYKYKGQFKDGLKHGHGILEDKDGTRYEGTFYKDQKDGEFTVRKGTKVTKVKYVKDIEQYN